MDEPEPPAIADPWALLRRFTPARIALGRAGSSLPTAALLEFQLAHASARDAVHLPLDAAAVEGALRGQGQEVIALHSAAADRHIYLKRPDLGRRLEPQSRRRLGAEAAARPGGFDAAFVVADGLSALAVHENAAPLLAAVMARLEGWRLAPVTLVSQARVAIGDEIGQRLGAQMVAVLIGERPGLSSPDSLGVYLTWHPRVGATDAQRNCISNIRPAGLDHPTAARRLAWLMGEARRRGLSGVALKDETGPPAPRLTGPDRAGNFLTGDDG